MSSICGSKIEKKCGASPITADINRRFFAVLDDLILRERVASLAVLCDSYGLNRMRYYELKKQYGIEPVPGFVSRYQSIEFDAVVALVRHFGVSLSWLVLGDGSMFKK